jgi:hypothetical protein
MDANIEREKALIEEAVADVETINLTIARLARGVFNPEATTGDEPGVPTNDDRHFVLQLIVQQRYRRDQLEERLLRRIYEARSPVLN